MYALIPILVMVVGIALFALFLVVTEYKPDPVEESDKYRNGKNVEMPEELRITTYNIGYCGLDKDRDFFLDGGTSGSKATPEQTFDNLIGITNQLQELASDVYLLQEVDVRGKRSNNINQIEHMLSEMVDYNAFFTYNYRAKWVPYPLFHPMGSAYSGLALLSRFRVVRSERIALEGQDTLPRSLFYPKRCMMVNQIQVSANKYLYLINVHLSAYDKGGMHRSRQIRHIQSFIEDLYDGRKNYVIVGGDFNLLFDPALVKEHMPAWIDLMPETVRNGKFNLFSDNERSTVRSLDAPYNPGDNFETTIDGFLVSPNLTVTSVRTEPCGFRYSDHNPVTITIQFKS